MPHPRNIYSVLDLFGKRKSIQIFHAVQTYTHRTRKFKVKKKQAMRRTKWWIQAILL